MHIFKALVVLGTFIWGFYSQGQTELDREVFEAVVREQCQVPNDLNVRSSSALRVFIDQYFGGRPMLTTAFLIAYTQTDSRHFETAYCVAAVMNVPLDPHYEAHLDIHRELIRANNPIPKRVFIGFDREGRLVFDDYQPGQSNPFEIDLENSWEI